MSAIIKAVVIEDDQFSIQHLTDVISRKVSGVEIVATCRSAREGIDVITKLQPDLVFLDVEMPEMNGFDMLRKLPSVNFDVIFTTSYEHYAIRAIRFSAVDYLLKPVDATALQDAISRLRDKKTQSQPESAKKLEIIAQPFGNQIDNLAVPTMEGLTFVSLTEIIYCEARDKYTVIHQSDGKKITASRTLTEFEEILSAYKFCRIHQSYLINIRHLRKYIKGSGGQVVMTNGSTLDVSRRKKDELLKMVSQF